MQSKTIKLLPPRIRDFTIHEIDRANLCEGLPYVEFNYAIRNDPTLQHIVIGDIFKILLDKCYYLKLFMFS